MLYEYVVVVYGVCDLFELSLLPIFDNCLFTFYILQSRNKYHSTLSCVKKDEEEEKKTLLSIIENDIRFRIKQLRLNGG